MRCLTSCLRLESAVKRFLSTKQYMLDLLGLLHVLKDEEVIANGCKSIRICLRDEKVCISVFDTLLFIEPPNHIK